MPISEVITLADGSVINVADYPLPAGVPNDVVNMRELARGLGVTTVTISDYIDRGMPVRKVGGNGVDYEFDLAHCFAWKKWRDDERNRAKQERDASLNQLALEFLGEGDSGAEVTEALSPKAMREHAEALILRNKAAEQKRELLRRHDMLVLIEDVFVNFRTALTGLPDWMEQEFNLSPSQVEKAQRFCDGVLEDTRTRFSKDGLVSPGQIVSLRDPDERRG